MVLTRTIAIISYRRSKQMEATGGDELEAVKNYFNTAGYERWKKIYGETDEVNKVWHRGLHYAPLHCAAVPCAAVPPVRSPALCTRAAFPQGAHLELVLSCALYTARQPGRAEVWLVLPLLPRKARPTRWAPRRHGWQAHLPMACTCTAPL